MVTRKLLSQFDFSGFFCRWVFGFDRLCGRTCCVRIVCVSNLI